MVEIVNEGEVPYAKDLEEFRDFQRVWADGTLPDNHPVMIKVKRSAEELAYSYKNSSIGDDLTNECLMALSTCGFNGKAKLETFIQKILLNKNRADFRQRGGKRQAELPEEMEDLTSIEFATAVMERLELDGMLKALLRSRNDLTETVLQIILEAEQTIGRRRIAELASKRLGWDVSRHQVELIYEKWRKILRNLLRKPPRAA
jgi:hypothetical protein